MLLKKIISLAALACVVALGRDFTLTFTHPDTRPVPATNGAAATGFVLHHEYLGSMTRTNAPDPFPRVVQISTNSFGHWTNRAGDQILSNVFFHTITNAVPGVHRFTAVATNEVWSSAPSEPAQTPDVPAAPQIRALIINLP
jgi:hypothetical protein